MRDSASSSKIVSVNKIISDRHSKRAVAHTGTEMNLINLIQYLARYTD